MLDHFFIVLFTFIHILEITDESSSPIRTLYPPLENSWTVADTSIDFDDPLWFILQLWGSAGTPFFFTSSHFWCDVFLVVNPICISFTCLGVMQFLSFFFCHPKSTDAFISSFKLDSWLFKPWSLIESPSRYICKPLSLCLFKRAWWHGTCVYNVKSNEGTKVKLPKLEVKLQ